MGIKRKLSVMALVALFTVLSSLTVYAATKDDVAKELVCQCGCNLQLTNCSHGECMSRDGMLRVINQKLEQGQTKDAIIQSFVAEYGEKVLASPPKQGFNLTAWIAPFAAILIGAVLIYLAVKKWVKRSEQSGEAVVVTKEEEDAYRQRLDNELKKLGERGYR